MPQSSLAGYAAAAGWRSSCWPLVVRSLRSLPSLTSSSVLGSFTTFSLLCWLPYSLCVICCLDLRLVPAIQLLFAAPLIVRSA
jgi:hypothetical protein